MQTASWPDRARALRQRMGAGSVHPQALAELKRTAPANLLVACSGGADSVCLLCILHACAEELGFRLSVAHYNHRWRAGASDGDASFVGELAQALGWPFDLGVQHEKEAAFTETTARALRLDFLRKTARERDCALIAFGHQLDDILETQLQRLARGSGSEGLAAPRPVSVFHAGATHLRPLLHLRAGDIRMLMSAMGIPWREDRSNEDRGIARNALRHEIIPALLESLDRDPAVGAARSRLLLEEDAAALVQLTRERLPAAFDGAEQLARSELCGLPRALLRRALAVWLSSRDLLDSLGPAAMDLLIDGILSGNPTGRYSARGDFIVIGPDAVWIEKDESVSSLQHVRFEPGETVALPTGHLLGAELIELDPVLRSRILCGGIDPATEAYLLPPNDDPLELRGWQPGDRFHPLGAPGKRKLKDWFIDRRVPRAERRQLPIVTTASGEIIWAPGFPPAERLKIGGSAEQALRLTYRPGTPP